MLLSLPLAIPELASWVHKQRIYLMGRGNAWINHYGLPFAKADLATVLPRCPACQHQGAMLIGMSPPFLRKMSQSPGGRSIISDPFHFGKKLLLLELMYTLVMVSSSLPIDLPTCLPYMGLWNAILFDKSLEVASVVGDSAQAVELLLVYNFVRLVGCNLRGFFMLLATIIFLIFTSGNQCENSAGC